MGLFKKESKTSDKVSMNSLSQDSLKLVNEALNIIEPLVMIDQNIIKIEGSGSEGMLMEAARKFSETYEKHPDAPLLKYGHASCLHLAAQYETAENEMKICADTHPDFPLAKLALEGWDKWESVFTLPPWGKETKTVHSALSKSIMKAVMLPVRDGIVPRATMFLRDASGDFNNLSALRSARISLASVISQVRSPQVLCIYAKIYDDPSNPYDVEILDVPIKPRGDKIRSKYEYLCLQDDIDFAVIDRSDRILLNRNLEFSEKMKKTNDDIMKMLQSEDGKEVSQSETVNAVMQHQRKFTPSAVQY
jgi:hypothetical protein